MQMYIHMYCAEIVGSISYLSEQISWFNDSPGQEKALQTWISENGPSQSAPS
jgi:hypothetical protein